LGSFCGLDDHPAFISHLLLQKLLNNYWALAAYPNLAMDSSVPMILPKGIVVNTKNIYKEVADFPVVPPDKVWEYWHGISALLHMSRILYTV
jgi:hypothetical protein